MANNYDSLTRQRAFDHYYSCGSDRSLAKTGEYLGIHVRTITNWSKTDNWQTRIQQRDIENARRMEEKTNEAITDIRADYRKIIKATIADYIKKLKTGEVSVGTVTDFERLVKLDLLLMGEATEKSSSDVKVQRVEDLSDDELIAIINGKQ